MRVVVDQEKCNGAGICVQELPGVFRFQEGSKKGIAIRSEVAKNLEPRLREVAAKCPTGAVQIFDR